jgi:hypothetical protein
MQIMLNKLDLRPQKMPQWMSGWLSKDTKMFTLTLIAKATIDHGRRRQHEELGKKQQSHE